MIKFCQCLHTWQLTSNCQTHLLVLCTIHRLSTVAQQENFGASECRCFPTERVEISNDLEARRSHSKFNLFQVWLWFSVTFCVCSRWNDSCLWCNLKAILHDGWFLAQSPYWSSGSYFLRIFGTALCAYVKLCKSWTIFSRLAPLCLSTALCTPCGKHSLYLWSKGRASGKKSLIWNYSGSLALL